ncbi:MAG: hypothetical protein AAGK71_00115 [Pseudomonadota bacterium]
MKTSDPSRIDGFVERQIKDASQDQIQRLLADIRALGRLPEPTHASTERLQ